MRRTAAGKLSPENSSRQWSSACVRHRWRDRRHARRWCPSCCTIRRSTAASVRGGGQCITCRELRCDAGACIRILMRANPGHAGCHARYARNGVASKSIKPSPGRERETVAAGAIDAACCGRIEIAPLFRRFRARCRLRGFGSALPRPIFSKCARRLGERCIALLRGAGHQAHRVYATSSVAMPPVGWQRDRHDPGRAGAADGGSYDLTYAVTGSRRLNSRLREACDCRIRHLSALTPCGMSEALCSVLIASTRGWMPRLPTPGATSSVSSDRDVLSRSRTQRSARSCQVSWQLPYRRDRRASRRSTTRFPCAPAAAASLWNPARLGPARAQLVRALEVPRSAIRAAGRCSAGHAEAGLVHPAAGFRFGGRTTVDQFMAGVASREHPLQRCCHRPRIPRARPTPRHRSQSISQRKPYESACNTPRLAKMGDRSLIAPMQDAVRTARHSQPVLLDTLALFNPKPDGWTAFLVTYLDSRNPRVRSVTLGLLSKTVREKDVAKWAPRAGELLRDPDESVDQPCLHLVEQAVLRFADRCGGGDTGRSIARMRRSCDEDRTMGDTTQALPQERRRAVRHRTGGACCFCKSDPDADVRSEANRRWQDRAAAARRRQRRARRRRVGASHGAAASVAPKSSREQGRGDEASPSRCCARKSRGTRLYLGACCHRRLVVARFSTRDVG